MHADIHAQSKVISSYMLENWDLHKYGSNLLSVVREIQAKFDSNPPLPEKMVQQQQMPVAEQQNALKRMQSMIQIQEEVQPANVKRPPP